MRLMPTKLVGATGPVVSSVTTQAPCPVPAGSSTLAVKANPSFNPAATPVSVTVHEYAVPDPVTAPIDTPVTTGDATTAIDAAPLVSAVDVVILSVIEPETPTRWMLG